MNRRKFLHLAAAATAAAATTSGVASAGFGRLAEAAPRRLRWTRHRVAWAGRGRFRVVHLTDLHLGRATSPSLLEQAVQLCLAARPDLVALTGDFLNRSLVYLPELCSLVDRLPRPCVATLGNHDHWSGAVALEAALGRRGVRVLRNAHLRLRVGSVEVPVVGVDDGFTGRDDVESAFAGLSRSEPTLVLTHTPASADRIARRGRGIVLAGHTHGGQIGVPVVTAVVARLAGCSYLAGWYDLDGGSRLYVNAGIGAAVISVRLGARAAPEGAVLDFG